MRFAHRLDDVQISTIRQIMERAAGCVNLALGEPHFFAPQVVREEARRVLEEERIGYSPNAGFMDLRRAVLCYHGNNDGHSVCVTNGSQEALFDVILTLVGEGDEVLVPDPGFPAYSAILKLAGARPVFYPLRSQDQFQLRESALRRLISGATRAIITNSPSNPTGRVLSLGELAVVHGVARENDLVIVSDEIYREIYYSPEKPPSIFDVTSQAVVLSGVSKMASMTGWRLGWACGPVELIDKTTILHQYTSSCASALSQKAALKVFTEAGRRAVERRRQELAGNCKLICSLIEAELGRHYVCPQGAFYVLLSVKDMQIDSMAVALELLMDGVATIPGSAFGREAEGYLRLSFACEPSQIEEGIARIKKGLRRLTEAELS